MSYEYGSVNYQSRLAQGWIEGSALYADEEPHHGPFYVYVPMHDPRRERLLARIIEGRRPAKRAIQAKAYVVDRFPKISDDPESDYAAAEKAGLVRAYLVRSTGAGYVEVPLPPTGQRGFHILSDYGWDNVRDGGGYPPEWIAEYFEATILREPKESV